MKPVIGIIICGIENKRQFVSDSYISCIEKSGGIPIIIPYLESMETTDYYLSLCDGFLFCGGDDVSPLLYNQDLIASYGKTNWFIDVFHITFMKSVLKTKKPVLSICRGMQIMNIALGGTLFQDISLNPSAFLNHNQLSYSRSEPSHRILPTNNSKLLNFSCFPSTVNSYHHQCIHITGKEVSIIATSPDNIAEIIELENHPFALGLQWHPECMYDTCQKARDLFDIFVSKTISI